MESKGDKKEQNPGGRPNLPDNEALTYRLVTRVNQTDYTDLQARFGLWNSGRSGRFADFLRSVVTDKRGAGVQTQSVKKGQILEVTQTLHHISQQLKSLTSNYNQITKRINSIEHTGKLYYEVQSSKATVDKIAPLLEELETLMKTQTEWLFD